MYLTTKKLDPNRKIKFENFDQDLLNVLPKDYTEFILEYGIGTYSNEVYINYPDKQIIPLTFKDDTDLWELNDLYNVDDLLKSVQIGSTANGDIICVTENKKGEVFVLPRHSTTIIKFQTFDDTINSFLSNEIVTTYFDPLFDYKQEQVNLIKSNLELIDILPIHEKFLEIFSFDFVSNENTQPTYFVKAIGGWITFDLIYKNSINVKFQTVYLENVKPIIDFLKNHIE